MVTRRALSVLTSLSLLLVSTRAADLHVPGTHPTIQGAIVAASPGDRILVEPGTYFENIDFLGKAVTVESLRGPELTIIDGSLPSIPGRASVVTFQSGEGADSVLDGFTLQNGSGTISGSPIASIFGGGVYCRASSPTIEHNVITANSAYEGGGIWCHGLAPTIRENTIHGNVADFGSGIDCESSSARISGNLIHGNSSSGGFSLGGGICTFGSVQVISNNVICDNHVQTFGGGIYAGAGSSVTLANNVITANSSQDKGGGLYVGGSSAVIANTVIWENTGPLGSEIYAANSTVPSALTLGHSDVRGGQTLILAEPGCSVGWGAGMIDADPLFAEPAALDFHLRWDSPCRNQGDNAAVADLFDIEGDDRIVQGTVDMGADEFHTRLYRVGTPAPGATITVKVVGTPGSPLVYLAQGSGLLVPPLALPYGDLHLLPPFPWFTSMGGIPAGGIRSRSATIPADWSTADLYHFQALLVSPTMAWELSNPLTLW